MTQNRPKCKKYGECLEAENISREVMNQKSISKLSLETCSACFEYEPIVPIDTHPIVTDTIDQSKIFTSWIKYRDTIKPVQMWEVELMIKQIREDTKLMIKIGKKEGWLK